MHEHMPLPLPAPQQPERVRTSNENEVERDLRSLHRGHAQRSPQVLLLLLGRWRLRCMAALPSAPRRPRWSATSKRAARPRRVDHRLRAASSSSSCGSRSSSPRLGLQQSGMGLLSRPAARLSRPPRGRLRAAPPRGSAVPPRGGAAPPTPPGAPTPLGAAHPGGTAEPRGWTTRLPPGVRHIRTCATYVLSLPRARQSVLITP